MKRIVAFLVAVGILASGGASAVAQRKDLPPATNCRPWQATPGRVVVGVDDIVSIRVRVPGCRSTDKWSMYVSGINPYSRDRFHASKSAPDIHGILDNEDAGIHHTFYEFWDERYFTHQGTHVRGADIDFQHQSTFAHSERFKASGASGIAYKGSLLWAGWDHGGYWNRNYKGEQVEFWSHRLNGGKWTLRWTDRLRLFGNFHGVIPHVHRKLNWYIKYRGTTIYAPTNTTVHTVNR